MKRFYTHNNNTINLNKINKFKLSYNLPSIRNYNEFCIALNNVMHSLDHKHNYNIEFYVFMYTNDIQQKLLPPFDGINMHLDKEKAWIGFIERSELLTSKYKRKGFVKLEGYFIDFELIKEENGSRIEDFVEYVHKTVHTTACEWMRDPDLQNTIEKGEAPMYQVDPDRDTIILIHK